MFFIHILFLVCADIVAYEVEIILIIADSLSIWLDYYNYMTLKKLTILLEACLQLSVSVISFSHIQRLFQASSSWISILFYIIQFVIVYPLFSYKLFKQFQIVSNMERDIKDEKMKKTLKGRINLKVRDKVESKAPEIIKKGLFSYLDDMSQDSDPEEKKTNTLLISNPQNEQS